VVMCKANTNYLLISNQLQISLNKISNAQVSPKQVKRPKFSPCFDWSSKNLLISCK